jgi:hypothetical protein
MELRGHEHVVECAVFAPVSAYSSIKELAGLTVSRLRRRHSHDTLASIDADNDRRALVILG